MNRQQRWVLSTFGALIGTCAVLAVVGNFLGAHAGAGLTDTALEGLKISISALVGALSAMLGGSR